MGQIDKTENSLVITTYNCDRNCENEIKNTLAFILEPLGCEELIMPIYTCINELLTNAIKANFKSIYFERYNPESNADQALPYEKALQLFKFELNHGRAEYFARQAQLHDIRAELRVTFERGSLTVEVRNRVGLSPVERDQIMKKIKAARKCRTITEYYEKYEDDPLKEGGGLGLIFIMLLLRSLGMPLDSFRITSTEDWTVSSITFPLTKATVDHYLQSTSGSC